ncbi:molybdopterin molybdotransferase MoeA [Panacagrimonas sp.]|uniref:molybdopterin molybdotransferase MoeA n=1 Tax=Panacagrimonas sp. TaxID=2480088 RepID=UPI003B523D58
MSLLSIRDALARIDAAVTVLPPQRVSIGQALHRVTAGAVVAACDLPPFDQSSMDGYALRAAEVQVLPARFPLAATVAAGPHDALPVLPAGHACRIYTGGLIPQGADTVVRQEWTTRDGDQVLILRATPVGQDLRRRGEELSASTVLMPAGRRLNAGHVAMLAMAGVAELDVRAEPRITVLVSGDEVVDAGRELRPGEVYNANGPLMAAWLARAGYAPPRVAALADTEADVRAGLQRAFAESDLVLTSGGVSVGDRDLILPQAEALGAQRLFWKVAQKPGKPLYVARHQACLLMGLPGNPASVLVNLASFVRRALDRLEGVDPAGPLQHRGVLAASVRCDAERDTWLRVRTELDDHGVMRLHPQGQQASHMLSNLAAADALAWIAAASAPLPAGAVVPWIDLGL